MLPSNAKCDFCLSRLAEVELHGKITHYACVACANELIEWHRKQMAKIRKDLKARVVLPEAWKEFMKERQTS